MTALANLRTAFAAVLCLAAGALAPLLNASPVTQAPAVPGFVRQLDKLHDKLRLRSEQQKLWNSARQISIQTQAELRAGKRALTELSETELERPAPDLGMLSRKLEALEQQNFAAEGETRTSWLKVYETLSPEQIGLVREALKSELKRYKLLQNLRERLFG
jgi:hypothetical protein